MLQYIRIKNLALLDEVTLEFESGFTVVTGETGAGKSVLLGGLGLLSGARTDKGMIRQGHDQLEVEAALYFTDSSVVDRMLKNAGLPECEEGVLILTRTVHRTKMPRIQINGSIATLSQLQEFGASWIDFHGPGEPQKLFQEKHQLEMLDSFAGNTQRLEKYQSAYTEWVGVNREIEASENRERLNADELEFIRKQIKKIDAANISESSIEELERDYARMSSAQELVTLSAECADRLTGEIGISNQLSALLAQLESLVEIDSSSSSLLDRARSVQIELQDLGDEIARFGTDFDFDPEAIEAVTERMNLWQEICRQYGGSVESVLSKREKLDQKVILDGDLDGLIKEKRKAAEIMNVELKKQAKKLTTARKESAQILAQKVAHVLQALGFKKARLEIQIVTQTKLSDSGDSHCIFLFSPNVGQELLPLNKIASSGETARVMLALKAVLAEADATPLLVFDEVDANVGGEVGRAVGAELSRLAEKHQVLCVTHLPQVASLARNHFVVAKSQDDDSTSVEITRLGNSRDDRLEELARMLGDRKSESALAHAEELLG
ncbi:MAG: DNA repair protein RecN [Verrucomicrobiota bacterium]|nr:DNA repair protein RecN [Verrucomicrobiota bacterium]